MSIPSLYHNELYSLVLPVSHIPSAANDVEGGASHTNGRRLSHCH